MASSPRPQSLELVRRQSYGLYPSQRHIPEPQYMRGSKQRHALLCIRPSSRDTLSLCPANQDCPDRLLKGFERYAGLLAAPFTGRWDWLGLRDVPPGAHACEHPSEAYPHAQLADQLTSHTCMYVPYTQSIASSPVPTPLQSCHSIGMSLNHMWRVDSSKPNMYHGFLQGAVLSHSTSSHSLFPLQDDYKGGPEVDGLRLPL